MLSYRLGSFTASLLWRIAKHNCVVTILNIDVLQLSVGIGSIASASSKDVHGMIMCLGFYKNNSFLTMK